MPYTVCILFCSTSVTVNIGNLANNFTVNFNSISNGISLSAAQIKNILEVLKTFRGDTGSKLKIILEKIIQFGIPSLKGIKRIDELLGQACSAADITAITDIIRQITTDQTNQIVQTLGDQITLNLNELTQSTTTINTQLTQIQQTLANQLTTIQNNFDESNQLTDNRITQLEQTINLLEQNLALKFQQLQINISEQIEELTPCK